MIVIIHNLHVNNLYKLEALNYTKRAIGDVSRAINFWKLLISLAIRTVVYIASKLPMNMEELQYNKIASAAKSYTFQLLCS